METSSIDKYIYFKNQDIAAMGVDIAVSLLEINTKDQMGASHNRSEEISFNERRKIRNLVVENIDFQQQIQAITLLLNELGQNIYVLISDK